VTGLVGTALILTGYVMLALRRDPAVAFAVASLVWMIHGYLAADWWLFAANAIAVMLATISILRAKRSRRRGLPRQTAEQVGEART